MQNILSPSVGHAATIVNVSLASDFTYGYFAASRYDARISSELGSVIVRQSKTATIMWAISVLYRAVPKPGTALAGAPFDERSEYQSPCSLPNKHEYAPKLHAHQS